MNCFKAQVKFHNIVTQVTINVTDLNSFFHSSEEEHMVVYDTDDNAFLVQKKDIFKLEIINE